MPAKGTLVQSFEAECELALSAFDCVTNGEKAVYASSELTSGRRLLAEMRRAGVGDPHQLKSLLGEGPFRERIWERNVAEAKDFARRVRELCGPNRPVITPAPLCVPGWSQPDYWAFWERVIREKTARVHFNKNWQFSSGCTYEFAVAAQAGILAYDHHGALLTLQTGLRLLEESIVETEKTLEAAILREHLQLISRSSGLG